MPTSEGRYTILVILAHPDDEAFGTGGTLSRYAAEGHDVYLVTATRGEAGEIAEPDLATKANLPDVRERELRCACEVYGIHEPILLNYVDGQLTIVNQGQAVGKLVRLIREIKPHVLITFGPDGVYGHYDHVAVHRWSTIAVTMAADPQCFPDPASDACEPHEVQKVYHNALSESRLQLLEEQGRMEGVMMDGVPFPFVAYPDDVITTEIDVGDYVEQKLEGIRCHLTQVGRDNPMLQEPAKTLESPSFRSESYILARTTLPWPDHRETDLLEGLE